MENSIWNGQAGFSTKNKSKPAGAYILCATAGAQSRVTAGNAFAFPVATG